MGTAAPSHKLRARIPTGCALKARHQALARLVGNKAPVLGDGLTCPLINHGTTRTHPAQRLLKLMRKLDVTNADRRLARLLAHGPTLSTCTRQAGGNGPTTLVRS